MASFGRHGREVVYRKVYGIYFQHPSGPPNINKMAMNDRVVFERSGVFIHSKTPDAADESIEGRLYMIEKDTGIHVEWRPTKQYDIRKKSADQEWAVIDAIGYKNSSNKSDAVKVNPGLKHKYIVNFELQELKSVKRSCPSRGWSLLIFILKDGTTFPALHFHHGGTKPFLKALKVYLVIRKSVSDSDLFLVNEEDPGALHRSFDELQLFADTSSDLVGKFIKNPYRSTLGGFAKVTNFLKDTLLFAEVPKQRPREEVAEILSGELTGVEVNQQEVPGFEVITTTKLPPRPEVLRSDPLNSVSWSKHLDKGGRVIDVEELKAQIFRGGIEPSIRIEVWKFLLGYYKWESTYTSRAEERKKRVDDYFRMKLQWKSVLPEQERRFSVIKERKSLIDKDVTRTDRTHPFFEGTPNPNMTVLYDVLMTYCMYDFDLGYVQGMSDLLAPLLVVMENEVDAFWCLAGFMELVHENFEMDQSGMKRQLNELHTLIQFMDHKLYSYLEDHESGNLYFCFRWLLILFKREFSFPDIMRFWEVLWTGLPCQNFHLLFCCAVIDGERDMVMENNFGFTEILRHINDMSLTIPMEDSLKKAESMYRQLKACESLPDTIGEILGLKSERKSAVLSQPSRGDRVNHSAEPSDLTPSSSSSEFETPVGTPSETDKRLLQTLLNEHRSASGTAATTPDDSSIEVIPDSEQADDMTFSGY